MACAVTALNSQTGDCNNQGGIVRSFGCKLADITAVTLTSGVISNFTMASTGLWKAFVYDRDATAFYNQTGAVNNNVYSVEQAALLKFRGISASYIAAANAAKDCCDMVFIHVLANGVRLVQGIEIDSSATGGFVGTANRNTRVIPSMNSDTGANEARMEYSITGNANTLSPSTSLSDSAIAAL
ncbi:MAG: hypothetical protein E6Q97_33380 [Desulfurellales bacterium]|nr:MAG: hypothetical protein E6Q97_33380 [Desulfurellales bacterium]